MDKLEYNLDSWSFKPIEPMEGRDIQSRTEFRMTDQESLLRDCPVCGSREAVEWLQKGQLRLVQCRGCSMVYANPVAAEFASGQYYDKEAGYYLSVPKLESDYAEVRFRRELRLFRQHCPAGAVLDVGCSSGGFLFQLTTRFEGAYDAVGTDVSGPALDYAESRGLRVIRGDFLQHDFQGKRFDAITFWAVLEHLSSPRLFLERAAGLLNEGGLCFVLVPNKHSLAMRLLGKRYRYIYPQHLNYFTAATLQKMAQRWFEPVRLRYTHFNPLVIWRDWRSRGAEVSNEARAELLRCTTGYKQNPFFGPIRLGYQALEKGLGYAGLADNVAVVFRKLSSE